MHCVHCFNNNLSCVTAYVLMSSSPDLDLANQEWLLSGPDVCLVTLTLQQPIVTKNTCFYGSNVVLHFVLLFAVAMQLRMNCFDDLFVPTDYYGLMSISGVHCTVHVRSSIRQPFLVGDLVSVCFHTPSPSSILYGIVSEPHPVFKFYVWLDGRYGRCCRCSSSRSNSSSSD